MTAWKVLLAAACVLAVALTAVSIAVAANGTPLGNEADLQREVQGWDWFSPVALIVNNAGDPNTWVMFLFPLPAWILSRLVPRPETTELLWLSVLLAFFALWNPALKEIIQSPRPSAEFGIEIDRPRATYGFPSGHVTSGILLFGSIAGYAWRVAPRTVAAAVATLAAAMIVLAGPARIHAGAHWPTDTLGGYLLGSALLCLTWAIFLATVGPLRAPAPLAPEPAPAPSPNPSRERSKRKKRR